MRIGFIGTGVMGKSIVKHFLAKGHEVMVCTIVQKAKQMN